MQFVEQAAAYTGLPIEVLILGSGIVFGILYIAGSIALVNRISGQGGKSSDLHIRIRRANEMRREELRKQQAAE